MAKDDVDSDYKCAGYGRAPLLWAAKKGYHSVIKLLLAKKVKLDFKDKYGQTPLLWAARGGHKAGVELLLEHGAEKCEEFDDIYSKAVQWRRSSFYNG